MERLRIQDRVLILVDLVGTFLFGMEGGLAGAQGGLDVFGVLVLAFVTALGGGVLRDLLIGAVPPNAVINWRYGATAFAGGAAVLVSMQGVERVPVRLMVTLDAAGLSLFAMAGVAKALEYGIGPFGSALMGVLTGVGGGTMRDVLLVRTPGVLRADIYAVAALLGAVVMLLMLRLGVRRSWTRGRMVAMLCGGAVCFALRMAAVWRGWNLPRLVG